MPQLTEAQLYNLHCGGSHYNDSLIKRLYILHLRHEHQMSIRDISKRMDMKMKVVQKYLNSKIDKWGKINLD